MHSQTCLLLRKHCGTGVAAAPVCTGGSGSERCDLQASKQQSWGWNTGRPTPRLVHYLLHDSSLIGKSGGIEQKQVKIGQSKRPMYDGCDQASNILIVEPI